MAKKTASSKTRTGGAARKTAAAAKPRAAKAARKKTASATASSTRGSAKKHVGDVLGISRARVSETIPSGGRRPKGIEVSTTPRRTAQKRARVVGGVRGRGV